MLYKILADFIVVLHFLWIIFLFIGALWGTKSRIVKGFHLSGLLFAILIQFFDWYCPLTHLEFWLRSTQDPALTYTGSFIAHYAEQIVYLQLSRPMVLLFTLFLLGFNAWVYLRRTKWFAFHHFG
ncbi:MAG: DUF2784 family protein [Deltaproteobacteria bacterium]|nr:MAG: DUF2784 family protein [Deltaproteobacteria bacterium]